MKKSFLSPVALSALVLALAGCGGESGNLINENESDGVTTSTSCSTSNTTCLGFVLDYPVAGLNFTCSSDNVNSFVTVLSANAVTGACKLGDTVNFSIQGRNTQNKLSLGSLDLNSITKVKVSDAQVSVLDLATALTGQAPQSLSQSDNTIKVAMALVKIFQAIGVQQAQNVSGDIQPISLTEEFKAGLSGATGSVTVNDYLSGNYANIIRNWVDVSGISDQDAFDSVVKLANQSTTGIYLSDILPFTSASLTNIQSLIDFSGLQGFNGRAISGDTSRQMIGNMYAITDRSGFGFGYGMQWKGVPVDTNASNGGTATTSPLLRINLLAQVKPVKMTATDQKNWLDPLSKRILSTAPFRFNVADDASNTTIFSINQGKLLNSVIFVASETAYKNVTKSETGIPADYTKWSQSGNTGNYEGTLEISKISPVSFLDRRVFKTLKNSNPNERYYFPLYADLEFKFSDTTITPVKLGIVIDENGDIRTNLGATPTDAEADNLSSRNLCSTVDSNMMGSNGVQQYRIGTTGAANFETTDKSLTLRLILADPIFKKLEGVIAGFNQTLNVTGTSGSVSPSGIKLNINNLLSGSTEGNLATITNFSNTSAEWANVYSAYQRVYNTIADNSNSIADSTDAEKALAKRTTGTITTAVTLPACYIAMLPAMVKPAAP